MKKILLVLLSVILALAVLVGCSPATPSGDSSSSSQIDSAISSVTDDASASSDASQPTESLTESKDSASQSSSSKAPSSKPSTPVSSNKDSVKKGPALNGVSISDYTIVYGSSLDYNIRAAEYIRDAIKKKMGVTLNVVADSVNKTALSHEIVVGETNRDISKKLDAKTKGMQFAITADNNHIAMEGDYFVIAAAAYYFVDTYINAGKTAVPKKVSICDPIVKKADNFIFLIGDGMGVNQTRLYELISAEDLTDYSDGEDIFYGYMFPYQGLARTNSLSGVTDSAAGGTALATGYKTINGYVGRDRNLNDVLSLTEIAGSLGKATAVMSTEGQNGATPASFSAHANSRNDTNDILLSQAELQREYNTLIKCNYDVYNKKAMGTLEQLVTNTLDTLSKNDKGFFLMYEEAHIDKHCHSNAIAKTFKAVARFNQAIALFMEYAFYNPNTFVLITADHETGGLHVDASGGFSYTTSDHTGQDVPVFVYGVGGEVFNNKTIENIQIPKTIASFWGKTIQGDDNGQYPALK